MRRPSAPELIPPAEIGRSLDATNASRRYGQRKNEAKDRIGYQSGHADEGLSLLENGKASVEPSRL